ncbi:MAG: glycosyltransferase family 2 protein [Anaerolineae bacterium]|nr:MAG: glycosyltransferase family 2 protein [Anaerolineae bacterium]
MPTHERLLLEESSNQESQPETVTASIIIPNWNGKQHLEVCLSSLRGQSYKNFETILVDNGSTDGSREFVKEYFPEVRLLELGENLGFTGACNAGYSQASGRFIILLNNDTEAEPAWLDAIVDAFERYPDVGIIASKILMYDQRDIFHSAGDLYRIDGIPINRGVWKKDTGQYEKEEPVFSACGAAAAYRRSLIEDVGFLDKEFYFSCEDVDMGWRAHKAGWKVLYIPTAVVYHKLKATGGSIVGSYYDGRNFLYLLWKHYPAFLWRTKWKSVAKAQMKISCLALKNWRGEAARARLRGQIAGLLTIHKIINRRQAGKSQPDIAEDVLVSLLSPVDEHPGEK